MALLLSLTSLPAVELPEAAGVIDVTRLPYNADNTGQRDATAALLQAMHEAGRRTPGIFTTTARAVQIVYLPKGIFRISDTLCFETAEIRAARPRRKAGRRSYIEGHTMLWWVRIATPPSSVWRIVARNFRTARKRWCA